MTMPSSNVVESGGRLVAGAGVSQAPTASAAVGRFHVPSLDGLRGVAVAIVVLSHTRLGSFVPGGFGVTIFFFLSGYLITTLLRREFERHGRISLRNFYLRRALRIFPPMYLALGLATALTLALGGGVRPMALLMQSLHLTNYYVFAFGGTGCPIGTHVLWSLSVEEHFYLVYPALYMLLARTVRKSSTQALILGTLCAAALAWRCVLMMGLHASAARVQHATDTRIDSILFGCILGVWRNPAIREDDSFEAGAMRFLVPAALLGLVASIAVRNVTFRETFRYTVQGLALVPVFVACIRSWAAVPWSVLNTAALRWLGLISYTLYLVHYTIIQLVQRLRLGALTFPIAAALAIALSAIIYRLIERPAARARRRLSRAD